MPINVPETNLQRLQEVINSSTPNFGFHCITPFRIL